MYVISEDNNNSVHSAEKNSSSPSTADIEKQSAVKEAPTQIKGAAKAEEGVTKPSSTKPVNEKGGKGKKGNRSKGKGKQPEQKSIASENRVHVTSAEVENAPRNDGKDINNSDKSEPNVKSSTSTSGSVFESETSQDTNEELGIKPKSDTVIHTHTSPDNTQKKEDKSDGNKEEPSDGQPDASLLTSPSSQSIQRPPPDHTDQEEAVLDKLSGAFAAKKVIQCTILLVIITDLQKFE